MYGRALSYYRGESVTQDYELARQWFEKAAAAGNASAMFYLGLLYDLGQGVAQDYAGSATVVRKSRRCW